MGYLRLGGKMKNNLFSLKHILFLFLGALCVHQSVPMLFANDTSYIQIESLSSRHAEFKQFQKELHSQSAPCQIFRIPLSQALKLQWLSQTTIQQSTTPAFHHFETEGCIFPYTCQSSEKNRRKYCNIHHKIHRKTLSSKLFLYINHTMH